MLCCWYVLYVLECLFARVRRELPMFSICCGVGVKPFECLKPRLLCIECGGRCCKACSYVSPSGVLRVSHVAFFRPLLATKNTCCRQRLCTWHSAWLRLCYVRFEHATYIYALSCTAASSIVRWALMISSQLLEYLCFASVEIPRYCR